MLESPLPPKVERPGRTEQPATPVTKRIAFWCLVLIASLAMLVYLAIRPVPATPDLPLPPRLPEYQTQIHRSLFFDTQVQPEIVVLDELNREAVARCVQRIREEFDTARAGVPTFVEDVTSYGTRFGVARRMATDWWRNDTATQRFMAEKFEANLFSESSLKQAIENALATLHEDLEANNNTLLTQVRAAISRSDLPALPTIQYDEFSSEVTSNLKQYSSEIGTNRLYELIMTEFAAGAAGAAATQIMGAVAARFVATAATSSLAAGGATASGTVGGGAGGSVVGPVGTVVGAAVGLVAGVAIDWWLTEHFQTKLTSELNDIVDQIESYVIEGSGESVGLRICLETYCDALRDSYRESLYKQLVPETSL